MTCEVDSCNNPDSKLGLCQMHYMRLRRTGTTDKLERIYNPCSIEGCTNVTGRESGLCLTHYKQAWYLKSVGRTELKTRTSQERWINMKTGYVMVKHNGRLTYEHIVLAEKALGKPLPPKAVVHHTNAKDDNYGFFKLVVCPNQEYHALIHKRMKELA